MRALAQMEKRLTKIEKWVERTHAALSGTTTRRRRRRTTKRKAKAVAKQPAARPAAKKSTKPAASGKRSLAQVPDGE